jgi:IS1 family transposase
VVWERTPEVLQGVIDRAPHAPRYFSDAALVYRELSYWGTHTSMYNKSETYSVEAVNADLRHYLAGLGRRSRCFSRCIQALRRAVDLFVRCYNARQLRKRKHPRYPALLAALI